MCTEGHRVSLTITGPAPSFCRLSSLWSPEDGSLTADPCLFFCLRSDQESGVNFSFNPSTDVFCNFLLGAYFAFSSVRHSRSFFRGRGTVRFVNTKKITGFYIRTVSREQGQTYGHKSPLRGRRAKSLKNDRRTNQPSNGQMKIERVTKRRTVGPSV